MQMKKKLRDAEIVSQRDCVYASVDGRNGELWRASNLLIDGLSIACVRHHNSYYCYARLVYTVAYRCQRFPIICSATVQQLRRMHAHRVDRIDPNFRLFKFAQETYFRSLAPQLVSLFVQICSSSFWRNTLRAIKLNTQPQLNCMNLYRHTTLWNITKKLTTRTSSFVEG